MHPHCKNRAALERMQREMDEKAGPRFKPWSENLKNHFVDANKMVEEKR